MKRKGYKMSKGLSKAIMFVLILSFLIGMSAAESLIENGNLLIPLLMVICPFGIGYLMSKKGWLDWIEE